MGVLEDDLGVQPWGMPLGLFLIAAACRLRGRRFVLLDVGADWAANPITRWLYLAAVRLATHVSYRDRSSAAAMARAGARESEAVAPDLAFAHPVIALAKPEAGWLVVGVMAYYGRKDDPIQGADVRRRYVGTMSNAVTQLARAGYQIVLVGGDNVDVDVAREIRAAVLSAYPDLPGNAVQLREPSTFNELTEEMTRAEVVIASRFHNLICALRLAIPTVSVGYAAKNRHLMEALGLDDYCQDIEHFEASWLVTQVKGASEQGEVLAARIRGATSDYAHEVQCLLERVATESLGLAAVRRELDVHGGTDAGCGT
jgi:polysaccharide pyruvyl transferase WcaK-like protein